MACRCTWCSGLRAVSIPQAKPRKRSVKSLFIVNEESRRSIRVARTRWATTTGRAEETRERAQDATGTPTAVPREVIAGHWRSRSPRGALLRGRSRRVLGDCAKPSRCRLAPLVLKRIAAAARPDSEQLECALNDLDNLVRAVRAELPPRNRSAPAPRPPRNSNLTVAMSAATSNRRSTAARQTPARRCNLPRRSLSIS